VIAHVLLFRPRAGLSADARHQLADALAAAVRDVPSLRRARVGRRITIGREYEQLTRTKFPFAAILEFDDEAALKAYLDHPVHERLAMRFFESIEETQIYDIDLREADAGVEDLL
jgi:hypothetical protein